MADPNVSHGPAATHRPVGGGGAETTAARSASRSPADDDEPPESAQLENGSDDASDRALVLNARIEGLEHQVAELDDRWRRALADLDNLRKRYGREVGRERFDERARVLRELLPVVDNLDLALAHAGADSRALTEGVRAVRDQATAALDRLGFARTGQVGVPFDPARHEAVASVPDPDVEPGTVVQVVRAGYGEGERQLRPAAVVVATRES